MYGIKNIGVYIPNNFRSNYDMKSKFNIDDDFIENKIGVKQVSIKKNEESTYDLCMKAFIDLKSKSEENYQDVDLIILVTQNPDRNIPHTSAMIHGAIGTKEECAAFDISLGCSGYVYALSVATSFMESNKLEKALIFTADPYSKIIDPDDKNTSLLFGDAASVSLISKDFKFKPVDFTFGTIGKKGENLKCDDILFMNGREIFNFAAKYVPKDIKYLIEKNDLKLSDIDMYVFHQGSKLIVDTICKRLKIESDKSYYDIYNYGNTVSSSIPLILEKLLNDDQIDKIAISGFGVGLSWSSALLTK